MPIFVLSETEVEKWIDDLGETFTDSEASFKAFEKEFIVAYDVIFEAFKKVAVLKESGRLGEAELVMSQWVDPDRIIIIGVVNKAVLKPTLLTAARDALKRLNKKFAIGFDAYPTQVYVFPGDNILIRQESLTEDLLAFGLT